MAPSVQAQKLHNELFPGHESTLAVTDPELVEVFGNFAFDEVLQFMLVALGGCEPQLKGHVAANLRVGNSRAILLDVLTQLLPFIGYPRTLNGLRCVEEAAAL